MCVIAWAWQVHPRYPLAVLANRDERHARASAPLGWWPEAADILGGRDLEAGGSWLGVSRSGRLAALTNRPGAKPPGAPSRGELVRRFLAGSAAAGEAVTTLAEASARYAGFNLLVGDGACLALVSNREPDRRLEAGTQGMANGALDEAIPKVERLVATLNRWGADGDEADVEAWFARLAADEPAEAGRPETAIFVRGAEYGTRSSSIVLFDQSGGARFFERRFDAAARPLGTASVGFRRAP